MSSILCPRCGMQAIGGKGFWGWSKPFCTACGWNVGLAKERKRTQLRQLALGVLIFAVLFGFDAYFTKDKFELVPFGFFLSIIGIIAITSWKQLRILECANPSTAFATPISSGAAALERTKQGREAIYQNLRALPRPRPVRLKGVPRVISIAFPLSWILIAYFGFKIFRNGLASPGLLPDLAPLLIILGIWSALSIVVMRRARKDRRLLEEGDFAIATVIHQELTGGRHPRSRITYEFKDAAGQRVHCETNDDSRTLYEEMETPVFYNSANTSESVPLACASCELKQV